MNRSFRAQNTQMRAMRNKEEELAMFLEMRKREKEQNNLFILNNSEEFDAPLGAMPGTSPIFNLSPQAATAPQAVPRKTVADDFLNSDNDKNDYDWLLTPPGTPLFPSLEMESQKTVMSQIGTPKARPTALKSRLANPQLEPGVRSNLAPRQAVSSPGLNSSSVGMQRPSSSGGRGSRPATPTGRPTLTSASKPSTRSSTPTSRATLPSTRPTVSSTRPAISAPKPSLSATKSTLSSTKSITSATKPTAPSRSTTPLSKSTARSSMPPSRASIPPASKPTSREPTPTRRPPTSSSTAATLTKSATLAKSASPPISRPVSTSSRNLAPSPAPSRGTSPAPSRGMSPAPSRGMSPTPKPRTWKPSDMPGFSLDVLPNLRTTLPDRPLSATRGRPGAPNSRSSSVEPASNGRPRRQSCSPSRGRIPNGTLRNTGSSVPAVNRAFSKENDNVSPAVMGTKMVERVISMRRLAPPRHDDKQSPQSNLSGKSSSPDSSGFGRTMSKKSLDMAIRHMDIRRTLPGNLRPLMTNIPASSMYSVRSVPMRSRTVSVSDSPLATSSNASSEVSVNNNGVLLEVDDDNGSERGNQSPSRVRRSRR